MPEDQLHVRLAENIAFLEFLGRIPVPPSRNALGVDPTGSGRAVPLRVEKDLCETLATLSCIKDDRNKITAVGIVEESASLNVLVAVNARDREPVSYLTSIKAGFETIFRVLRVAKTTPRMDLENEVFLKIIAMCREKIISRLRFDNSRGKASVQSLLAASYKASSQVKKGRKSMGAFRASAEKLIKQLKEYGGILGSTAGSNEGASDHALACLVDGFCELSKIPDLEATLLKKIDYNQTIPRTDPSARQALLDSILKISKYREAAERLVKLARPHAKIRHMTVTSISLDESALARVSGADITRTSTLRSVAERLALVNSRPVNLSSLCKKMKKNLTASSGEFRKTVDESLLNAKIHAEMQIVWYLVKTKMSNPPRVLGSSKDACYLCNAFISINIQYYIPRSHGRVYAGWRLPATGMDTMVEQFNIEVERLVLARIKQVTNNNFQRLADPAESRVFSALGSTITVLTVPLDGSYESDSGDSEATITPETASGQIPDQIKNLNLISNPDKGESSATQIQNVVPQRSTTGILESSGKHQNDGNGSAAGAAIQWHSIPAGKTVGVQRTGSIHLYVEYTSSVGPQPKPLRLRLHQLVSREDAEPTQSTVVDGEDVYEVDRTMALDNEVQCRPGCRSVSLRYGKQILKVEFDEFGFQV